MMPRRFSTLFLLFILVVALSSVSVHGGRTPVESTESTSCDTPPLVVVSLPPYAYLVKQLAGEKVDLQTALPADYNPHNDEIRPRQMEMLQGLDLWIGVGEPFEKPLLAALEHACGVFKQVQINDHLPLITLGRFGQVLTEQDAEEGTVDVHFWMSPRRLIPQVDLITEALESLIPQEKSLLMRNKHNLLAAIKALDLRLQRIAKPIQGRAVVLSHPVLGYLCTDYGLKQIGIESSGQGVGPQLLFALAQRAESLRALCAFKVGGHGERGLLLLAQKLELPIYPLCPTAFDLLDSIEQVGQMLEEAMSILPAYDATSR